MYEYYPCVTINIDENMTLDDQLNLMVGAFANALLDDGADLDTFMDALHDVCRVDKEYCERYCSVREL